ncbi:zinc finger CCCH domain-containing protein 11A [Bombina bombina]|uniref:zinc finger CCCH domain-containing protein 11A n=1 Tax=Bombina bombina TaxID=8345 RepID=UPI00235A478C|nr:zinc finger CCCH domain-containing protein 11A [Bombina bombina]
MSNKGDDCYFFFYSTCSKGDSCMFRHCEAAIGNETVCTLWQEGRCFRQVCKFRHMEIDKKRSEIPCYWETQPTGCQKANCAFRHIKARVVDGVFMPPSKATWPRMEESEDPLAVQQPPPPSKISVSPTPQLRGVKKIDATENVPSPTHPPVVINAADDDEDDDDQFSEDEVKNSSQQHSSPNSHKGARVVSTRKVPTPKKDVNLNFGIKTLNEIKSRKQVVQEPTPPGIASAPLFVGPPPMQKVPEKDLSIVRTVTLSSKKEQPNIHLPLAHRLGKRKATANSPLADSFGGVVKKSISERLGRKAVPPTAGSDVSLKTVHIPRPLKERLGLPVEQNSTETEKAVKPSSEFRIKTLEEIRQEKASQKQEQAPTEPLPSVKVIATSQPALNIPPKKFFEVQAEKRKRQLQEMLKDGQLGDDLMNIGIQTNEMKKDDKRVHLKQKVSDQEETTQTLESQVHHVRKRIRIQNDMKQETGGENVPVSTKKSIKIAPVPNSSSDVKEKSNQMVNVRIKTLEEIRKEKALRLQKAMKPPKEETVIQPQDPTNSKKVFGISRPTVNIEEKKEDASTEPSSSASPSATVDSSKISVAPSANTPVTATPKLSQEEGVKQTTQSVSKLEPTINIDSTPTVKPVNSRDSLDISGLKPEVDKKKARGKPRVNVEPRVVKNRTTSKKSNKRKNHERPAVAAVRPLSPAATSLEKQETPSNESLLPAADSSLTENVPASDVSPKCLQKSSVASPSGPDSPNTLPAKVKSRRTSSLPAEDDFDKLIWEISGGKLGDEIDLEPGKDEDDLLLELSEMIDN